MTLIKKLHALTYTFGLSGLLLFAIGLSPALALANGTLSVTPSSGDCDTNLTISLSGSSAATPWYYFYNADGSFINSVRSTTVPPSSLNDLSGHFGTGACGDIVAQGSIIIVMNDADGVAGGVGACQTSYASCSGGGYVGAQTTYTYSAPTPPSPANPIGDYLNGAESGFASTTGFNIGSLITWSGTNLIEVFVGSGLGLLLALRYWIVALVIIAGVIYFSFRAFQFYKN